MKKWLLLLALLFLPVIALAGASRDFESGESDYLTVTDTDSLSITGNLSIAFWMKAESQPTDGNVAIFLGKYLSTGNQRSYFFYQENAAGTYSFKLNLCDDGAGCGEASVDSNPGIGTWKHIAVSWVAATSEATFYVNGASVGTATTGSETSIFNSTATFVIGNRSNLTAGQFYDGLMADVGVWASALSANDITELYAGTPPDRVQTASLRGSWPLFGSISPESDLSGNGNALTLTNSPAESFDGHPFSQPH